jgi:hypothetical protein
MCWNTIESNWAAAVARLQPSWTPTRKGTSEDPVSSGKDLAVGAPPVPSTTSSAGELVS